MATFFLALIPAGPESDSNLAGRTAPSQTEVTHLNSGLRQLDHLKSLQKWPPLAAGFKSSSAQSGVRVRKIFAILLLLKVQEWVEGRFPISDTLSVQVILWALLHQPFSNCQYKTNFLHTTYEQVIIGYKNLLVGQTRYSGKVPMATSNRAL